MTQVNDSEFAKKTLKFNDIKLIGKFKGCHLEERDHLI